MAAEKTSTLTIRVAPGLKDALRRAAEREHRSLANMVEVIVRDYCGRVGVEVAEPQPLPVKPKPPAKSKRSGSKSK